MAEFKRLTPVRDGNLGSLGCLPLELCNKIYAFLLTDFHPQPDMSQSSEFELQRMGFEFIKMSHSIDTAILRVSRNIHLEAYDLMVKKNRFVHVKSRGVLDWVLTLLPVVTANADHVSRFKGYVLEVTMASQEEHQPGAHDHFEVMILAQATTHLCYTLMQSNNPFPGFVDRVDLTLNLGVVVTANREARDKENLESLEEYFSEKTQKEILQPFGDLLYDVQNIHVRGLVSADVANSICKSAASGKWGGPQDLLDYFTAEKETGMRLLDRGEDKLARKLWITLAFEISKLHTTKHWPRLSQEGGEPFITQLAELHFRLNLNCAHLFMVDDDKLALQLAQRSIQDAHQAMTTGHWKEEFTWQPPRELRAKLHFRTARFLRLRGDSRDVETAADELEKASLLCPDDPAILRERHLLADWTWESIMTAFTQ